MDERDMAEIRKMLADWRAFKEGFRLATLLACLLFLGLLAADYAGLIQ